MWAGYANAVASEQATLIVFGDVTPRGGSSPNSSGRAWMRKITVSATATVDTIGYLEGTGSVSGVSVKGLIYDATGSGGYPGALLAAGPAVQAAAAGTVGTAPIPATTLAPGTYWIGVIYNDGSGTSALDSGGGDGVSVQSCLLNANDFTTPNDPAESPPAANYTSIVTVEASGYV